MALTFAATATTFLSNANAIVTGPPCTLAAWFFKNTATAGGAIISVGASTTTAHLALYYDNVEDVVARSVSVLGGIDNATSAGAGANSAWVHGAAVFNSTELRTAYRDGGNAGTNTATNSPLLLDRTFIGDFANSTGAFIFPGHIAEAAIWNVALNAADVAALAKGVVPPMIRPDALVAYWPLVGRDNPEPDFAGGFNMTLNGTPPRADHVRVYNPRRFIHAAFQVGGAVANTITLAISAVGVPKLIRRTNKNLVFGAVGVARVIKRVGHDMRATAVGVARIIKQAGKILRFNAVGVATISLSKVYIMILAFSAVGVARITKQTGKVLAFSAVGVPRLVRQTGKIIRATAVGVATISLTFIAGAVAALAQAFVRGIQLIGRLGSRP